MIRRLLRLALILVAGFIAFLFIGSVLIALDGFHDDLHAADLAVVPGALVERDGRPSLALQVRLDQAAMLYHQGYFKLILVSGAREDDNYDEPAAMRRYLEAKGIPHDAIFEDGAGFHTWETAQDTAAFLREHQLSSVLVISQFFHMPRCRLAMEKFGIKPVYSSHAQSWDWDDLHFLPHEVLSWCLYLVR